MTRPGNSTNEGREGSGDRHGGPGEASGREGEMVRVHWIPPELIRDLARPTLAELGGGTDLTPYVRDVQAVHDGGPVRWADPRAARRLTRISGPTVRMRIESWAEIDARWDRIHEELRRYLAARKRARMSRLRTAYRAKTRRRNRRTR